MISTWPTHRNIMHIWEFFFFCKQREVIIIVPLLCKNKFFYDLSKSIDSYLSLNNLKKKSKCMDKTSKKLVYISFKRKKDIMNILDIYEKASGQRLNVSKSSMLFGNWVEGFRKQDIKDVLGFFSEDGMGMYLGLPEQFGGSKIKVFSFVQNRFNGRVNTWSSKL